MIRNALMTVACVAALLFLSAAAGATAFTGVTLSGVEVPAPPDLSFASFDRNTGLLTTSAELARVSTSSAAAVSLASLAANAQTFDFDFAAGPWSDGSPNCVPDSGSGTFDLSASARDIWSLGLDYGVHGDATSASVARDQILAYITGTDYDDGTDSRANQCALDLSEGLPHLLEAAWRLEEDAYAPWTASDRAAVADWLIAEAIPVVSWAADDNDNNWGAEGMSAAYWAAEFVKGYASEITLWDDTTLSPAAYQNQILTVMLPAYLAGDNRADGDTCEDAGRNRGMQSTGALPEEMRRSGTSPASCDDVQLSTNGCTGGSLPYEAAGSCGGAHEYQLKAIQGLVRLAEAARRVEGDGADVFDLPNTTHGGVNEPIYDGLLMASTADSGSLGDFQDYATTDAAVGAFHVAGRYYADGCMVNVIRDTTSDANDYRGGVSLAWTSITHADGVAYESSTPACGSTFVSMAASDLGGASYSSVVFPNAYYEPPVDTSGWSVYDVTCIVGSGTPDAAADSCYPAGRGCSALVGDDSTNNSSNLECMYFAGVSQGSNANAVDTDYLLYFPDGTYNLGSALNINSVLRPDNLSDHRGFVGESRTGTIIQTTDLHPTTSNVNFIDSENSSSGSNDVNPYASTSWNSGNGASRGATTIVVASTANMNQGGWVELRADSVAPQTTEDLLFRVKIESVGSGQITIDRPLPDDFTGGNATAMPYEPAEKLVFRSLTIRDKYPDHQQGETTWIMQFQYAAEVEMTDVEVHGYQSPLIIQNSARVAFHTSVLHNNFDKPFNTYGISSSGSTHISVVDSYFYNTPEAISCGGQDQEWLVAFNHFAEPEENSNYDSVCDGNGGDGGGNDCDVYLDGHTGTSLGTEHGETWGFTGSYTHCNDVLSNALGYDGSASCHGTRSQDSSGGFLSHGPSCNNSTIARNTFENGIWLDWQGGGPGRNNFYFGNALVEGSRAGGANPTLHRGPIGGGDEFGGQDIATNSAAVAQHEWNPIFIANSMGRLGTGSMGSIDAGMNGAVIRCNTIRDSCEYDGGASPNTNADADCTDTTASTEIGLVSGASIDWQDNDVGSDTWTCGDTMPSAPGFDDDPGLGGSSTFPYVGADMGTLGGTSSNCLPAYERFHGSC